MMIATLAMLSVVGSAQYARAQQTGTNQNAKELSGGTILSTVKGVVISAEDGMPVYRCQHYGRRWTGTSYNR